MASSDVKLHEQKNCCWSEPSEKCAKAKRVATPIVAALTSIVLLGGVLFILAQQGYNLGGINAFAQMMDAKWVYLGSGIAASILAIAITCIIIQNKAEPKTFTDDELEKRGFLHQVTTDLVAQKLPPNSYAAVSQAPVYGIVSKNAGGQVSVTGFRTQADATAHVASLQLEHYRDGSEIERQNSEFQPAYVEAVIQPGHFEQLSQRLLTNLQPGWYCETDPIQLRDSEQAWPLALHDSDGARLLFFKTEESRKEAISHTDFLDQRDYDVIALCTRGRVRVPLPTNAYWLDSARFNDLVLYTVAFRKEHKVQYAFFKTRPQLDAFVASELSGATDASAQFYAKDTYPPEYINAWGAASEDIQRLEKSEIRSLEYSTHTFSDNFPSGRDPIFTLLIGGNSPPTLLHFMTREKRQKYIDDHLKDRIDRSALNEAAENAWGYPSRFSALCRRDKDYCITTLEVNGRKLFAILIYAKVGGFETMYWHSEEERALALQKGGDFGIDKGYTNAQASYMVRKEMIECVVTEPDQYGRTPYGDSALIFFRTEGQFTWQLVPNSQLTDFLASRNLKHDALEAFWKAERYPPAFARKLSEKAKKATSEVLASQHPYLCNNEFVAFDTVHVMKDDPDPPLGGSDYWRVYILLTKHTTGEIECLHFKTEEARKTFCTVNKLTDACERMDTLREKCRQIGRTLCAQQDPDKRTPVLFTFEYPETKFTGFVIYGSQGIKPFEIQCGILPSLEIDYVKTSEAQVKLLELQKTHHYVTPEEWESLSSKLKVQPAKNSSFSFF